jgi:hypothetical protein
MSDKSRPTNSFIWNWIPWAYPTRLQATGYRKTKEYHAFSRLKPGACRLKPLPDLAETMTKAWAGQIPKLKKAAHCAPSHFR